MEIMPKNEMVTSSKRTKLGVTQAVIECKLPVNNDTQVSKILCASAKSYISAFEANNGEVNFSGNVNFQVIYENEDKVASALDYTADFKDKFVSDKINPMVVPIITSNVVDVNTTTLNNEVKVVAIVEICVEIIHTEEVSALVEVTGDQVFTKTETINYSNFLGVLSDKFEVGYDVEIKDNILQVLEVSLSPYLESVVADDRIAKVTGGANVDICYLTNGETPLLRSYQTTVDFVQEVALDALTSDACIQSNLNINYSQIKVTTNIDADNAIVNLSIPYDYLGYAFSESTMDVVTDVFSLNNYVNVSTQSVAGIKCAESLQDTSKVSGYVTIEDNFIDEVLGTCCNTITLATSAIANNTLTLEGVASTTVIYLNKETNTMHTAIVEMPFSITENLENVTDDYSAVVTLSLGEVSCRLKRGSELEVNATLFVYANLYGETLEAVITGVTIQDEKPETNSVLTIYVVKPNETVWDIAKELNISPDDLLYQNPNVNLPLMGGEKLIVYRQKEVLF